MGFDMSKKSSNAVFAIFQDRATLEKAVDELKMAKFRNSDISVLMQNRSETTDFAEGKNTKASAGVLGGGVLGWLVGAGTLSIPGIGPFVAAGPIMGAIAGAGVSGTVGNISDGLISLGIPEYEAKRYEAFVKDGGLLISVHVDDMAWSSRAKDILENCGAREVSNVGEVKNSGIMDRESSFADKSHRGTGFDKSDKDLIDRSL
jgi:hypothetical protein